jgi:hypothetical protein
MKSLSRLLGVLALVAAFASAEPLSAQISIGGFNSGGNQSNRDDENNNNQNTNRQGNRRSQSNQQSSGNSDVDQVQQFLQGGQGGQNNQGNQQGSNQFRRNQQGQNQQGNNLNNQQFQNWNQNNQSNQSGVRLGTWQNGKWQGSNKIQNWTKAYGGEAQPFSSQWYQSHPKAWKYNNNNANVWVVGTVPGVYGWLGWGDVPREYRANYGNVQHFDHSHYGDWYPLGVYSLMSGPGDDGTRIVQLVIDRHGHIAGNYYDMITAANYSVSGEVSRQSQRVSWSLNKNKSVRFRASLFELMQPYGTVSVRLPGGEQHWQFVRLED